MAEHIGFTSLLISSPHSLSLGFLSLLSHPPETSRTFGSRWKKMSGSERKCILAPGEQIHAPAACLKPCSLSFFCRFWFHFSLFCLVEVLGVRFWSPAKHPRIWGRGIRRFTPDQVSLCTPTDSNHSCLRPCFFALRDFYFGRSSSAARIWVQARDYLGGMCVGSAD